MKLGNVAIQFRDKPYGKQETYNFLKIPFDVHGNIYSEDFWLNFFL